MERTDDEPAWPDHVDDSFPGQLIPEIGAADLSVEAIRSGISHHGSLIVRGLVGRERAGSLVDGIDRALAAYDATLSGNSAGDAEGYFATFERDTMSNREGKRSRGSVMTVDVPPVLFDLIETFESCGLRRVVRDYFDEPPLLLARKGTLRRIEHDGNTGAWHQDGAFMGAGIRSLNIWLALTHCGDDAPGIDIVGRRLDEIVRTGGGAFAPWATDPEAAEEAAEGACVRPIFDPGDVLIFDQMNLHRTAIDPGMVNDRYAIETWLLGPSSYGAMSADVDEGYSPRDQIPILF